MNNAATKSDSKRVSDAIKMMRKACSANFTTSGKHCGANVQDEKHRSCPCERKSASGRAWPQIKTMEALIIGPSPVADDELHPQVTAHAVAPKILRHPRQEHVIVPLLTAFAVTDLFP